jgi:squalene-hopene/tetraprenyl-beta-curcumene cyclase
MCRPIHTTPLLLAALWAAVVAHAAEPVPPDEPQMRAAITRSLEFLAREGDRWMNEKDCNSCHHMPELIWSHREAKQRGFPIDQTKLDEFIQWSKERKKKANAGLEMEAFLKLAMPETPTPELTKLIVAGQLPDGTWKPAGQFTAQHRPLTEATENSARIFALALSIDEADRAQADAVRAKAAAVFAKAEQATSVDTLVYRTLYARRFGKPDEVTTLRQEILKAQHADGGWSWVIAEPKSDPLATGEALYILQQSADESSRGAIARGQAWLVGQQREDGSWPIDLTRISKNDRSAPDKAKSLKQATEIYTYWGTGWATIGLLQGVPIAQP